MARRTTQNRDPYWLTARWGGGVCSGEGCNERIQRGDKVFYYPRTRAILATRCGHAHAAARDFEAHRADEDVYGEM